MSVQQLFLDFSAYLHSSHFRDLARNPEFPQHALMLSWSGHTAMSSISAGRSSVCARGVCAMHAAAGAARQASTSAWAASWIVEGGCSMEQSIKGATPLLTGASSVFKRVRKLEIRRVISYLQRLMFL
ncbi:hypothetical protein C7C56_013085 [Massilia glaciei]|uniref:Uncharacterized protein n=2 Tax=Massilia glaciei TaxID=1524097 RepID=A0A2U2HKI8_9BURK|nr:hypothetical protein C7C56_013085 [Massilia glaciei]